MPNGVEVLWNPVKGREKTWEGEAGMTKRCYGPLKSSIGFHADAPPGILLQQLLPHAKAPRRKAGNVGNLNLLSFLCAFARDQQSLHKGSR